jgi:prepilin-type N-terminal cleavage/methylation domain-containing protein
MLSVALRRRRPRGEDGFTLAELLVAMVVASIVGALALSWFIGASNATTTTTDVDNATASARNVLQTWGRMLQLAGASAGVGTTTNGIQSINATSITFSAYLSNSGACSPESSCAPLSTTNVTLALTGGKLYETIGSGKASVVEASTTTAADATGCLFVAYTATGLLGCSGTLTSTQLASITSIVLSFKVMTSSGSTRTFQTTAALAN